MSAEHSIGSGVREVKSAARTVELLELLASKQNRPTKVRDLSEEMGIPRSSLHALLRTLAKHGWVRGDSSGSMYMIGIRALLAGTSYLDADPYLPAVQSGLDELHLHHDETFHFGRLDGTDVVYLATRESSQYLRQYSRVGRRLPAYATALGKSLLAHRTGSELDAVLPPELTPLTAKTLVSRQHLAADLELTRSRGFAVDREENTLGLICFAVALPYSQPATDAISVSIPLSRLTEQKEAGVLSAMHLASEKICGIVGPIKDAAWL